jgi:hypothetical protein
MGSFFEGLINPDFSANDFKKRSLQKSSTIFPDRTPSKRKSLFEDASILKKSISYTSKENVEPNEAAFVSDPFRPAFIEQSA